MSSPVSLRGAANQRTSPSSSVSPLAGSRMRRNAAMRFFGRGGANASITSPARGPDTRTTATPARPGALDSAKIVGASAMCSPSSRAARFSHVMAALEAAIQG